MRGILEVRTECGINIWLISTAAYIVFFLFRFRLLERECNIVGRENACFISIVGIHNVSLDFCVPFRIFIKTGNASLVYLGYCYLLVYFGFSFKCKRYNTFTRDIELT